MNIKDLFGGTWIGEHPTNEHNQYLVVRYFLFPIATTGDVSVNPYP